MVNAMEPSNYVHVIDTAWRLPPGGEVEVTKREPAIWTLAHRGHSGMRRLDLWAYPDEASALRAGAVLGVACLDTTGTSVGQRLLDEGRYVEVLAWYEEEMGEWALLRVLPTTFVEPDTDAT